MTVATPEFSRALRLDQIGDGRTETISANPAERGALALRFELRAINRLEAAYVLTAEAGGWRATGRVQADVVQACVATAEDVPARIDVPFDIRFVDMRTPVDEEIELDAADLDVLPAEDGHIDLGEAAAQTLALHLDPWPRAPDAERFLRQMGVQTEEEARAESGPLSGLKALLGKQ